MKIFKHVEITEILCILLIENCIINSPFLKLLWKNFTMYVMLNLGLGKECFKDVWVTQSTYSTWSLQLHRCIFSPQYWSWSTCLHNYLLASTVYQALSQMLGTHSWTKQKKKIPALRMFTYSYSSPFFWGGGRWFTLSWFNYPPPFCKCFWNANVLWGFMNFLLSVYFFPV